jgi:hypothetical protein
MAGSFDNGNGSGSFYLEGDDAKGLGNTEFMRKSKSVRRTFPKSVNNPSIEMIQEVSSLEMKTIKMENGRMSGSSSSSMTSLSSSETASTNGNGNGQEAPNGAIPSRRKDDSSLDMFRSMAKDIRRP